MTDKINDLIISLRDKLQMTSIVVTHDISSAYKIADKIAMIHEGKIIFTGTPGDIRKSRNPYIQQFIRGQRKIHYAVEGEETYDVPFEAEPPRKEAGPTADRLFSMPFKMQSAPQKTDS
jgi:phospholipid/cholesterol/gamma-HCH transport system ATP-binding protein